MKFSSVVLTIISITTATYGAFVPSISFSNSYQSVIVKGYLDDLDGDLYGQDANPDPDKESFEATKMKEEDLDRAGPGNWDDFVDFNEFDGGDGQMGVAGDGKKGLERLDNAPQMATSKTMSAKNAWGSNTGYAEELRSKGVETSRAQQLENWANQQEVRRKQQQMKEMTESFDRVQSTGEEDWRTLAKFGVERTQEFDMDEEFGAVSPGNVDGTIELKSGVNKIAYSEFGLKNDFMGFADFRAAFTPDTKQPDWTVEPVEGTLSKDPVKFIVKFRPSNPGVNEGFLVIDTEDMKKTFKLIGSTA